jgi:hypothetical protein
MHGLGSRAVRIGNVRLHPCFLMFGRHGLFRISGRVHSLEREKHDVSACMKSIKGIGNHFFVLSIGHFEAIKVVCNERVASSFDLSARKRLPRVGLTFGGSEV